MVSFAENSRYQASCRRELQSLDFINLLNLCKMQNFVKAVNSLSHYTNFFPFHLSFFFLFLLSFYLFVRVFKSLSSNWKKTPDGLTTESIVPLAPGFQNCFDGLTL